MEIHDGVSSCVTLLADESFGFGLLLVYILWKSLIVNEYVEETLGVICCDCVDSACRRRYDLCIVFFISFNAVLCYAMTNIAGGNICCCGLL